MTLIRRMARVFNLLEKQHALIEAQARLITDQDHELQARALDHAREMQGLVAAWLINLERPELDMRDSLAELDTVLGHRVAQLEEHIV